LQTAPPTGEAAKLASDVAQITSYVMTAFIAGTVLLVLKLKVTRIDTKEKTITSIRKILTKPALNLYFLLAMMGLLWGVQDSYLTVYMKKEMQATTAIIS
jgi:hypothetical protein